MWGSKVIPVDVSIDNGKIYVNNNVSKTVIEPGSEIISINDVPASELLNTIKRNKYGDSDAMRSYGINNKTFPRELWLYLGFNKHFYLRVISPGGVENQVSLKGIYQPSFYKRIGKLYPHKPTKLIDSDNGYYYTLQGDSVGIINYSSFGGDRDSSFFCDVFARAHVAGVKHLFIDLRGNGGGSTNTYRHIVSYLTDDTLKMFSNIEYKVSDDLLKDKIFGDNFPYADDSMGSMVSIDKSLFDVVPYNTDVRYDGSFYCVSDAGTYSTASGFCALIQDNSLGKLVGEPTGGMGASFGNFVLVELPNAKLKCTISTTFYVRGNGDAGFNSIIPDVYLELRNSDFSEILKNYR